MKLAIVVPYYNISFFKETLYSLENQTNKEFNLYIGNDASSEDPMPLIDSFPSLPLKRYHAFSDNLGGTALVNQWERCIDLTDGEEWIMILGDDDIVSADLVQHFYDNIEMVEQSDIQVIRCASRYIDQEGRNIHGFPVFTHPLIEASTDSFYRKLIAHSRSSLSEHIFSRTTYTTHGFENYPLGWHSDDMAWLRFTNFKSIFSINDSVVGIRITEMSISGKINNLHLKQSASLSFFQDLIKLNSIVKFQSFQQKRILMDYCRICKRQGKMSMKLILNLISVIVRLNHPEILLRIVKTYIFKWKSVKIDSHK